MLTEQFSKAEKIYHNFLEALSKRKELKECGIILNSSGEFTIGGCFFKLDLYCYKEKDATISCCEIKNENPLDPFLQLKFNDSEETTSMELFVLRKTWENIGQLNYVNFIDESPTTNENAEGFMKSYLKWIYRYIDASYEVYKLS